MLVAGTVALDLIARVPRLPTHDEAVRAEEMVERFGGCAGNVARALARLGHTPTLLSAVGPGFAGSEYESVLEEAGADLSLLVRDPRRPTARAFLASDTEGHQTIVYHQGATPAMTELAPTHAPLAHFGPGEFAAYPELMEACDVVTFDPGQESFYRPIEETLVCLPHCDILLVNNHEARTLANHTGGLDGLLGDRTALVVTDAEGQDLHTQEGTERITGVPADPVDVTGAGDAHRAGFLHGYSQGWDLATCCRLGSVVAACAVEVPGAQEGQPSLDEALARYEEAYGGPP